MAASKRAVRSGWRSSARAAAGVDRTLKLLGKEVRRLRLALELTQEETADRANLDAKHVQDIEHGRTNPTVATLVGLAKALSVGIADLFPKR